MDRNQLLRFNLLHLLVVGCSLGCVFGQLFAEEVVKTVDLRNMTDSDATYYLVFCAKEHNLDEKSVGHAWVMWGKEDHLKKMSSVDKAYGFWPKDGKGKYSVVEVPGDLVDELIDESKRQNHFKVSHRLIVKVNKSSYDKAMKAIGKWKNSNPDYNLFKNSCKNFVFDVANAAGLKTNPVGKFDWPEAFLIDLIKKNTR